MVSTTTRSFAASARTAGSGSPSSAGLGVAAVAAFYPALKATVLGLGNVGKVTLPQVMGVSHWGVIAAMVILFLSMFRLFEKKGL